MWDSIAETYLALFYRKRFVTPLTMLYAALTLLWSVTTLGYAVVTLCVVLLVQTVVKPYLSGNIPPFPATPYPVLGHLPYFANGQRQKLLDFRKRAGDIFSLYFGSQLFVVVNGPRLVKELLVKHAETMSSRAPQPFVDYGNDGIAFSNGALWKEQRDVSMAILRSFGMGKSSLADKISEEVGFYLDTLAALKGKPENVRNLTVTSISNVICSIIVGERFDFSDKLFVDFVNNFTRQVAALENINPVVIWPWLRHIPGNFLGAKTLNNCVKVIRQDFCDKFIEMAEKGATDEAAPTFITAYLEEMEKAKRQGKDTTLSREQLRVDLQNLFIAGTDTTAVTILWFMVYMLNFPDVQQKVYEEICSVTGPDRLPDIQDKAKLSYTKAVLMESQRLCSIAPQSIPHYCTADTTIEGYTIPKGTIVLPSLDSVLMDEVTWEEPLEFKPERFLNKDGNVYRPDEFIPFSIGPRRCMGEALANMEVFLYTTSLLKRFELKPSTPGQVPSRKYQEGLVCSPLAFQVCFIERTTQ